MSNKVARKFQYAKSEPMQMHSRDGVAAFNRSTDSQSEARNLQLEEKLQI